MNNFSKSEDSFFNNQTLLVSGQAVILLVGSIIENFLKYGYNIVLARALGAELLGKYFVGLTVITFIATIGCFGFDGGIVRYVSQYLGRNQINKANAILYNSLRFGFFAGLVLTVIFFILDATHILHRFAVIKDIGGLYIAIPFLIIFSLAIAFFQGYKKLRYQAYAQNICRPVLNIIFFIIMLFLGYRLGAAIWSFVLAVIFTDAVIFYFLKKRFGLFGSNRDTAYDKKGFLYQSFWFWVILLANLALRWSDTIILSYFRGYRETGIYNIAIRLSVIFEFFTVPLTLVFGPVVSHLYDQKRKEEINRLLKTVTRWLFSIIAPLFVISALSARTLMGFFGQEFTAGWHVFIILSSIFLFSSLTGTFNLFLLTMTGRIKLFSYNMVFFALFNIILNLIFVPKFGMFAAAIISSLSFTLMGIVTAGLVYYFHKMHPYSRYLLRPFLSLFFAGLSIYAMQRFIPSINNMLNIIIFIIIYCLTLGFREEDKMALGFIKQKIINL